jgi:predicted ATPase
LAPAAGADESLALYRVLSPSAANPRRRGFSRPDPTPFVGRGEELGTLLRRWRRVCEGEGQMASIIGEPGIGKSRLIEEFRVRIGGEPNLWIEGAGAPLFATTPFYAVGQMLEQALDWRLEPTPEGRLRRLEDLVRRAEISDVTPTVSALAELVNLPLPAGYPALAAPADQKRARVFAALARWVFSAAANEPMILVLEDLHWVDPSTLEFVETLAEQCTGAPLLLIATARPEFRPPWASRAHHAQVVLGRLSDADTRDLVGAMATEARLAPDTAQLVIERADGVPLFAEELTRLMRDRGREGAKEIPATLQDSLVARLDRLGGAKKAAQLGAVLGREFSYELIRAVSTMPERELKSALAALAGAELIQARGVAPSASYRFKHALSRDAAYDALLKRQRRKLHERVAQTITEQFPALAEAQPEVLARHWAAAGDERRTVDAWAASARAASARHAYKEAAEDYRLALEMLGSTLQCDERDRRELELLGLLIGVLQIIHGYSAAEVDAASLRARELGAKIGPQVSLRSLFDEWAARSSGGEYRTAIELAEQLLPLARDQGGGRSLAAAYMALLSTRNHAGDLIGAEAAFEAGRPYFSEMEEDRAPGFIAQTFGNAAINAWILGEAEEARHRIEPVRKVIGVAGSPYGLAFSEYMTSMLALMLGELEEASALSAQSIRRSSEHGFPQFAATSSIVSGCASVRLGDSAGLSLMLRGIAAMQSTGNRSGMTVYLTWLAQASALSGDLAAALQAAEDALTINSEEGYFRPESLRLRGELNLRLGNEPAALADLRAAVDLAKSMRAEQFRRSAAASLERALLLAAQRAVPRATSTPRRS